MLKPSGVDPMAVDAVFATGGPASGPHGPVSATGDGTATATIDPAAGFVLDEARARLAARLETMRLDPARCIVDVGSGPGTGPDSALVLLHARFPDARIVAVDRLPHRLPGAAQAPAQTQTRSQTHTHGPLRTPAQSPTSSSPPPAPGWPQRLGRWLRARMLPAAGGQHAPAGLPAYAGAVAADAASLPFASGQVDLVWSSMAAHWFADPLAAVAEWRRVLRPGGLVVFAAPGPDFAQALRPPASPAGWPVFQDMHDWGDALVHAGFVAPVTESERLVLTYAGTSPADSDGQMPPWPPADPDGQMPPSPPADPADGPPQPPRPAPSAHGRAARIARDLRGAVPWPDGAALPPDDALPDTLELEFVFGHAWVPVPPGAPQQWAPVRFEPAARPPR